MTPAARASSGLGVNVVHDVVIVWFAGNDYRVDTTRHVVETEYVTRLPRNSFSSCHSYPMDFLGVPRSAIALWKEPSPAFWRP
jgi:hypothetical protein